MPTKISKLFCRSIIMGVIIGVMLNACQTIRKGETSIEDPDSALLAALIQKSDFSEDWQWIRADLLQKYDFPQEGNHDLVETARFYAHGKYKNKFYFLINHLLRKYQDKNPWVDPSDIEMSWEASDLAVSANFTTEAGKEIQYKCIKYADNKSIECKIRVEYDQITSLIGLQIDREVPIVEIEEIINDLIAKVDGRMSK